MSQFSDHGWVGKVVNVIRTLHTGLKGDGFGNVWPVHTLLALSLACSSEALPLNEVDESAEDGAGKASTVTTTGTSDGSGGGDSDGAKNASTQGSSGATSGGNEVLYPPSGGGERRIFGELDGNSIDIEGEDSALGFEVGSSANLGSWTTSVATGDAATVYLWSDGESTQGLLEIAPADPGALEWVCLRDVQISADETSWHSSKLSRLGSCDPNGGLPLELSVSGMGGAALGSFRGEPVDWSSILSGGSRAGFSQFLFGLDADQQASLALHLPADQNVFTDGEYDVASARLVIIGGEGAAACGGSGVVTNQGDGGSVAINIDEFSALRSCPGDAADGQLSGGL
jgi:hypothetical protein